ARYAVVEGRAAWIGAENFGEAGCPEERRGNRGWSVIAEDEGVASALRAVFEADFDVRQRDSIAAMETTPQRLPLPPPVAGRSSAAATGGQPARFVLAPDTALDTDGILGLFASAAHRLSIEAFHLD